MSREIRKIPFWWQHPKDENGQYVPLLENYKDHVKENLSEGLSTFPDHRDYMPDFTGFDCDMFVMYETCSEGTPISPPLPSEEALARWLAENEASAFAFETATYEQWLAMIKAGSSCSAVVKERVLQILIGKTLF